MANINDLSISYPDFKLNDVIDPEQFDTNNAQIVQKVNEVINKVNTDGADAAVTTARIADSAVTTSKIADLNVTTTKIADLNVTTSKLNDSAITTAKVADANITTIKIADGNITTAKIADSNITTSKIADANVTTAKLADNSVTGSKILDGTITNAEIATGTITQDKLVTGTLDNRYYTETETDVKLALKANIASPSFTGTVTVPAPINDTDASTKKYVDDKDATQKTYIDAQDATKVNKSGDTLTGYLTLHANPTNINHPTTKDYTDSQDALRVSKSGDVMTGALTLSGAPTQNLHASTKQYTDTQDALKVSKSGDTMTGALTLSGNPIQNLEAAPKQYVDQQIANLVSTAPGTLDTLNEIATALGNDPNFATTITTQLASKAPLASPTFTGTVTIPSPVNNTDAATKSYVDTQDALKAPINNPTFTGAVTLPGIPLSDNQAATKKYVDDVDATKAPINSPSFTGTASFGGNVDFNKNQAIEFAFENLASAPLNPIEGQIYYNTVERKYYGYKGAVSGWADLSGKGALIKDKLFTATAGQKIFDLSDVGTYFTGTNAVTVMKLNTSSNTYEIIGEANYAETSSTVITLSSGATVGDKIWIKWFENNPEVIAELSAFLKKDGTVAMIANLNLGGYKVTNLATPTVSTDAATKGYVDSADALKAPLVSPALTGTPTAPTATLGTNTTQLATTQFVQSALGTVDLSTKVSKSGDTMTGLLTLSGNPTANLHAAPKQYVDNAVSPKAPLASPTFTGTVTVPTPTNWSDAANKDYVDMATAFKAPLENPTFFGTVGLPITNITDTLKIEEVIEKVRILAFNPSTEPNIEIMAGSVVYFTSNNTANFTLNFLGDWATTLDTFLLPEQSVTVTVMVTNGATAYYPTTIKVDSVSKTVKWIGGTAPTSGNANAIDVYTFVFIKTATNTYTILGSQSKFA